MSLPSPTLSIEASSGLDLPLHDVPAAGEEADREKVEAQTKDVVSKEHRPPRVRYLVEYRDRDYGDILATRETTSSHAVVEELSALSNIDEPVFDVVTSYNSKAKGPQHSKEKGPDSLPYTVPWSKPKHHIKIHSSAVINALQSVVKYYPSQSLISDPVVIDWPYPVLVHHYDELIAFKDAASAKNQDDLCLMERPVVEHLGLLMDFLNDTIMPQVREEQERNKRNSYTWEYAWVGHKPGRLGFFQNRGTNEWVARIVHSVTQGTFTDPQGPWTVSNWDVRYDGEFLGRVAWEDTVEKFDGEARSGLEYFLDVEQFTPENVKTLPKEVQEKIDHGKLYLELLKSQPRHFKGRSRIFPHREHDGLVMVDIKDYLGSPRFGGKPELMSQTDINPNVGDGTCLFCRESKRDNPVEGSQDVKVALFDSFNFVSPDEDGYLDTYFKEGRALLYVLLPVEVDVFVFKTRHWEPVHVKDLSEPQFDEEMIHGLVMDPGRKHTLQSLAKSFGRRDKHDKEVPRAMWSADFVKGKGSGLIFLLHGRPGVGKTCTAECIAAFSKRPLMVLTPSDIGITPYEIETSLTKMFKRAMSWDAVLLIDEADVFMERRSTSDLQRNSLVAGFLRALENYDGILFLTTNRVGSFDDAFISRVHIQLYYPEFTNKEREQVWKTFIDKLHRERGQFVKLNVDAKAYIRGAEMREVEWNGREIRNALQTAVALAEYDAEQDEDGKIIVSDAHLRAVVELSSDFKKYLNMLHRADEGKRAARKYERLDDYEKSEL